MPFFGGLFLLMGLFFLWTSTLTEKDWILRATLPFKLLGEKAAQIVLRVFGVLFILLGSAVLVGTAVEEANRQAVLAPTATAARATFEVRRATVQVALATTETIQDTAEAAQKTATARVLLRNLYLEGAYSCQEAPYSPDGTKLVITGKRDLFVWDLAEEGYVVRELTFDEALRNDQGPSSAPTIGGVSYSLDGHNVAAIGRSGVVKIWDTQTWQPLRMLAVDPDGRGLNYPKLVFSPDGQRIATWGGSFEAMVWDTDTGERVFTLSPGNWIDDLTYSLDGQNILTIGGDTLRIWDAHTGRQIGSRNIGGDSVEYSADGHRGCEL